MVHRSRLTAPLLVAALLAGCNAIFDIEDGTLVEGEAGDAGEGGSGALGGKSGAGGKGASGGTGGNNGGKAGAGGNGGSNGGSDASGGSGANGGSDASGGSSANGGSDASGGKGGSASGMGGSGGTGGSGGVGASGGALSSGGSTGGIAGGGPFACQGTTPTCTTISHFVEEWGSGNFHGGASVFGAGLTQDESVPGVMHVTGQVDNWGHGFNLWFTWCSDLSAATGVTFTLKGTTSMSPSVLDFQVQTNSTYPWQPFPAENQKGACTAPNATDPWGYCITPWVQVPLSDVPQTVTWASFMGGAPVEFDATTSPSELVGVQWQFPWSTGSTPYTVDITLDDVKLAGIAPEVDCGVYSATGGASGIAGAGP